ncbi:LysR substrate-binding domain-containing protein [Streptomyces sp. WAC08241]|uniref:LysR substrate-binding domain-containing protein n=1 Tax=Streptomyces sp. WAC08241 TaxID=2487421 RepID=UPI000F786822|nr:LysR family transcriptional regulator [Streptomyces sp. WAC08241]RSS43760.1 LysR family transcriptional regulator [Streptomyces sp. WAC08241]
MELRHLRYFVAVAEERHFGRAAARLHVTQSTLSAQVQGLEREVGGPLFARTSRRVELTEAGELLLPEARRALAQAGRALSVARQSVSGEVGRIRVGFSGVAALHGVLAADLHRFRRAHPGVEIGLTELPPAAQVEGLHDGTIDIGYCPDLGLDTADGLSVTPRARTSLAVAMRGDHALAAGAFVTADQLRDLDLVVFATHEEEATVTSHLPAGEGHRARVHAVGGTLGVLALAAAGAGVAVVPAVTEHVSLLDLTYLPSRGTDGPALVSVSRTDELSGAVRAFVDCQTDAP